MIQQKEEGGSSCDDRPLLSLFVSSVRYTIPQLCIPTVPKSAVKTVTTNRIISVQVFLFFIVFLRFYIFTFLHFTADFRCFLPRISRISRIFLSTARIANPTERQYPLNPCHPCSFRFCFYHGFHRSHGFFSAPHSCLLFLI